MVEEETVVILASLSLACFWHSIIDRSKHRFQDGAELGLLSHHIEENHPLSPEVKGPIKRKSTKPSSAFPSFCHKASGRLSIAYSSPGCSCPLSVFFLPINHHVHTAFCATLRYGCATLWCRRHAHRPSPRTWRRYGKPSPRRWRVPSAAVCG